VPCNITTIHGFPGPRIRPPNSSTATQKWECLRKTTLCYQKTEPSRRVPLMGQSIRCHQGLAPTIRRQMFGRTTPQTKGPRGECQSSVHRKTVNTCYTKKYIQSTQHTKKTARTSDQGGDKQYTNHSARKHSTIVVKPQATITGPPHRRVSQA
jgi:hypothetical protein